MRPGLAFLPDDPSSTQRERALLGLVVLSAALVRLAMILALDTPIASDAEAYLTMARTALDGSGMRDQFGNAAFYSPGYPLFLVPVMALFGASAAVAQAVNLALALGSTVLCWSIARRVTGSPAVGLIAATGFAFLIPAAVGAEAIGREPLSTALLLLSVRLWLALLATPQPRLLSALAGALFAAMLVTGAAAILTCAGFLAAVALRPGAWAPKAVLAAVFAATAALALAPWLAHVRQATGVVTLTTNGPFNLYLGNNSAADGRFVSIADTPIGPAWHATRARLGEAGTADLLKREAAAHIRAHPGRTAELAARKLALFWAPNLPDAADPVGAIRIVRWLDVAQHLLVMALALVAVREWRHWNAGHALLLVTIAAFWAVHAAAYVMPRYREPVMPLVLVFAAIGLARLSRRSSAVPRPAYGL